MPFELPPCAVVRKEEIDRALAATPKPGKRLLEPLKSRALAEKLPLNILEDCEVSNEAEVHRHEGDLWHCLQGEVTFVYGGAMVNPWAKSPHHPESRFQRDEVRVRDPVLPRTNLFAKLWRQFRRCGILADFAPPSVAEVAGQLPDGRTDEREIKAKEIVGGTEVVLKPGDWLWIPAGQPHLHKTEGTARLVIVKIPAKETVPLEAVPGWHG